MPCLLIFIRQFKTSGILFFKLTAQQRTNPNMCIVGFFLLDFSIGSIIYSTNNYS